MQALVDIVEKLCSSILSAEPDDLAALADAHAKLEAACAIAQEQSLPAGAADGLKVTAGKARSILEKIILNEATDAQAQLGEASAAIADLQRIVDAATRGESVQIETQAAIVASPTETASTAAAPQTFNPDDAPLIKEFIAEAQSHIETAEGEVLKVEEDPSDAEAIGSLFRAFHTIKGVAGFLNLNQIQGLAHAAESLLDQAREGKLQLTGAASELVLQSIDLMKKLIASLDSATAREEVMPIEPEVPGLVARLDEFVKSGGKSAPSAPTKPSPKPIHEPADHLETTATEPAAAHEAAPAAAQSGGKAQGEHADKTGDNTIKVSTDRLDSLINMVGELVIAQSMVSQDTSKIVVDNQRLGRNMGHLGKITRELQDLSMSLRMVPIDAVFRKMPRLVRDVARKLNKEVELVITGRDTEVDRNVVEALGDPLVHMVRNSIDHGIEVPDVRQAAGKPRTGKVELRAYHQGGNINIEIIDNGRGLNKAKILKKAVEAGIVHEGQQLSDQEIFRLIFHAGLSTADKVTDVSGRGVGMDVVKQNLERLRGRIEIQSTEGQGSTFIIRLPLTLAVIDGLIVKVGPETYVLPILSIEQSVRPKPEQISTIQGRGEMIMVRGTLLPLIRLHALYNVEPVTRDPSQSLVVIVQDNDRRACLLVDELLGQEQVVIKSLGDGLDKQPGISGGAVLGDGNVSLILDVPGLIELFSRE